MKKKKIIIILIISIVSASAIGYYFFILEEDETPSSGPPGAERIVENYLDETSKVNSIEDLKELDRYVHDDSPEMNNIETLISGLENVEPKLKNQILIFISNSGRRGIDDIESTRRISKYEESNITYIVEGKFVSDESKREQVIYEYRVNVRKDDGRWLIWKSDAIPDNLT